MNTVTHLSIDSKQHSSKVWGLEDFLKTFIQQKRVKMTNVPFDSNDM